jgi:hypothetical protein
MTVADAVRERIMGLIGQALMRCAERRPRAAISALHEAVYHLRGLDNEVCQHCGKPGDFTGPCGVGGCPLGADL